MHIHAFHVGPLQAACYLVEAEDGNAALIDPGGDADLLLGQVQHRRLTLRLILMTHGHVDHIGALPAVKAAHPDALVCIHAADAPMLLDGAASLASLIGLPHDPCPTDRLLADGDSLPLGPIAFEVLHTPGHTPGGACFLVPRAGEPSAVFTGDTLFAGGIGRTDFPGGSFRTLAESIRTRLYPLPPDTVVYPGHGEPTTIGEERETNPFVR